MWYTLGEFMARKFEIKEIKPRIFHFHFKDSVTSSLHFLRFEEIYESSFKEIRNKNLA